MANVTGITETAQKNIVAALENYKKGVTGAGYGVGGFNNYIKGDKSTTGVIKFFGQIVKEFQNEFALEVDKIIKVVNNLETSYSKVDTTTSTFTSKKS